MRAESGARERESIRLDLQNDDEEVRRLAVERGAALPAAEAIPYYVECLGDLSWRVRKAAVERLVASPETAQVADALIGGLADAENPGRRNSAIEALVRCGRRVVPQLLDAAQSDDPDLRKLVVDALAGIGDERSTARLVSLLGDPDANVRAAAADALSVTDGPEAEVALLKAAQSEQEASLVRYSALRALARLQVSAPACELGPLLEDPVLRPAAHALLGHSDDEEAVEVLLKGLLTSARSGREAAMESLLRILGRLDAERARSLILRIRAAAGDADALVEDGIERLDEADLATRLVLVQFLGLLERADLVLAILRAGRDEAVAEVARTALARLGAVAEQALDAAWEEIDTDMRRDACGVLERTHGARSAARLLGALDDPDPDLRRAAARALGARGLGEALPALVRRLGSAAADEDLASEEERVALTDAIAAIAAPGAGGDACVTGRAVELLSAQLEGAPEPVRAAVATLLGRIGRPEEAQIVAFLLKDPSADVRRAAVDGLARVDPDLSREPLRLALADESPLVRGAAASALGRLGNLLALEDLQRLTEDEDPRVRAAAVRAIGANRAVSQTDEERDRIAELIAPAVHQEAAVAMAAIDALSAVGGKLVGRIARSALGREDHELIQSAVACIAAHGDDEDLEQLLPLVSHARWTVRAEATQGLADRGFVKAIPPILRRLETEQDDFVRDAMLRAVKQLGGRVP